MAIVGPLSFFPRNQKMRCTDAPSISIHLSIDIICSTKCHPSVAWHIVRSCSLRLLGTLFSCAQWHHEVFLT
eukprot:scaffold46581_cov21-Tisochrysis_lutea.AAC.2